MFTPFQPHRADAGAARTSPGRYQNRVFNHCVKQQKSLPKSILTKAVGNEEQLQNMHIPTLSKKPRTTHLPWRQTKETYVIKLSNICELCRATTQCKSTNQTMPGGYYNNTSEQPSAPRSADKGCPKPIDRHKCLMSCLKLFTEDCQALAQAYL